MTGTSTSDPNYTYFKELVTREVYDENINIEGGIKVLVKAIPVKSYANYTKKSILVIVIKDCEGFSFARCDQNRVGEIVATFVGGYDGTR